MPPVEVVDRERHVVLGHDRVLEADDACDDPDVAVVGKPHDVREVVVVAFAPEALGKCRWVIRRGLRPRRSRP